MTEDLRKILADGIVQNAIQQAWIESNPGSDSPHENGGFIVRNESNSLEVVRRPHGSPDTISVPLHANCRIDNRDIIATFHTHPNTGQTHLQEPSQTDRRAVRDDLDLKGEYYIREFVISQRTVYLVTPSGSVERLGNSTDLLGIE